MPWEWTLLKDGWPQHFRMTKLKRNIPADIARKVGGEWKQNISSRKAFHSGHCESCLNSYRPRDFQLPAVTLHAAHLGDNGVISSMQENQSVHFGFIQLVSPDRSKKKGDKDQLNFKAAYAKHKNGYTFFCLRLLYNEHVVLFQKEKSMKSHFTSLKAGCATSGSTSRIRGEKKNRSFPKLISRFCFLVFFINNYVLNSKILRTLFWKL